MASEPMKNVGGSDGHLAHCRPFTANSMHAEWDSEFYLVFSYKALIAVFNRRTGEKSIGEHHYSSTTTKHQNLCRAYLATARTESKNTQ